MTSIVINRESKRNGCFSTSCLKMSTGVVKVAD